MSNPRPSSAKLTVACLDTRVGSCCFSRGRLGEIIAISMFAGDYLAPSHRTRGCSTLFHHIHRVRSVGDNRIEFVANLGSRVKELPILGFYMRLSMRLSLPHYTRLWSHSMLHSRKVLLSTSLLLPLPPDGRHSQPKGLFVFSRCPRFKVRHHDIKYFFPITPAAGIRNVKEILLCLGAVNGKFPASATG